jgi:hypothetical protein
MINNAAKRLWEKPTHAMVSIIKTKLNQICQFENKESIAVGKGVKITVQDQNFKKEIKTYA